MRPDRRQIRALAVTVLAFACGDVLAADAPSQRPRVEQFFRKPELSGAALSPDGRLLALRIASKDTRTSLAVLDLQTMQSTIAVAFRNVDVNRFMWVNDKRLVFNLDTELTGLGRVDMAAGLFAVNHDGTGFRQLVESSHAFLKNQYVDSRVLPWHTFLYGAVGRRDSDEVFVVIPDQFSVKKIDYINLRRLNTVTGLTIDVDAPLHSTAWVMDQAGELRATVTGKDDTSAVHYRDAAGSWTKVDEFNSFVGSGVVPRYVDGDGKLYVRAHGGGDKAGLYIYDPASRTLSGKPVLASPEFDLDPDFIATDQKLLGLRYTIDAEVTDWLDPGMKAVQAVVDKLLPRTSNRISVGRRAETSYVLVESFSDMQPNMFNLYDTKARKLIKLGAIIPDIAPDSLGATDMVRYKARDGMQIPAYLTIPAGGAKKKLPLVVLVHGGPWVRGTAWGWNPEVQFLASRGYAVLQPEFRGSTGFGSRHFQAGLKQWGLAMQNDVADGARWAIASGIADPKRICIAGASYGGYSALMGLVNDPELFRCGIEWAGVTDIDLMYSVHWSDFSDDDKRYGMPALVGDRTRDAAQLKATSPLANAARIHQPLLMAYGAWDVRVPIVHGEKFRDAVRKHNDKVEWVVYGNEGHGWRKPENQVDFWTRVEAFLQRNLSE